MKHLKEIAESIYSELNASYDHADIAANPGFKSHIDTLEERPDLSTLIVEYHEDGQSINVYATTLNLNEVIEIAGIAAARPPVKDVPFIAAQTTPNGTAYLHILIEFE